MHRALVVDDSQGMGMILSRALAASGFEVVQAVDGSNGLACMEREGAPFRLVMVDRNMPAPCCLDFIRAIRARSEFDAVRLLMVTTETELEQVERALGAGADEYLMKPFTPDSVKDKLRLLGVAE